MKSNRPLAAVIAGALGGVLLLSGCGGASAPSTAVPAVTVAAGPMSLAPLPREITPEEAQKKQSTGAFVLDVREPSEWEEFHVSNTKLIPLGQLEQRLAEIPRDREVVIVCRSGNRSGQARDILLKSGYPSVTSMAGGLLSWRSKGFPTVSGK